MRSEAEIIAITEHWVKDVVIGLNFCPFASRPVLEKKVRFCVAENLELTAVLEKLISEMQLLDREDEIETTLLILPFGFDNFEDYLFLLDQALELSINMGYEGVYQLASFHPEYLFDGAENDDPANYTNRSPFPIIHLIREENLEDALKTVKDPEKIPERNIMIAREKGILYMQSLLASVFGNKK